MKLCRTAFYFLVCAFVPVQGQPCTCTRGCDNTTLVFPGSGGRIVDVAYGKAANMSSRYEGGDGISGPACMAVNGKTGTEFRTLEQRNPNCVHTAVGYAINDWWEVDLGRNHTVTSITIYSRKDAQRRMSGIHVEVDNRTCYTFPLLVNNETALLALPEEIDVTCTPPLTGRVVRLQKRGQPYNYSSGAQMINICEVQVWGCRDGLYGADCVEQCGQCADSDTCSAVSGHCPRGCQPGWKGDTCKQMCDAGKYDNNCSSSCGHCNTGDVCHHINGTCPRGCAVGFDPSDPLCKTICQNGRYGEKCSQQCGHCSRNEPCNPVTGMCASCQPEFQPPLCTVCEGKMYGTQCDKSCSAQCGGDGSCHRNNGTCQAECASGYLLGSGFCDEKCQSGAFGPDCVKKCGNCAESRCNHRNGTCEVGCIDGYVGDMCTETSESSPNLAGPVAGGLFGGLCVIALSILFVGLLIRRSRKRSSSETTSPRQASTDQNFEAGAPVGLNRQVTLQEETASAGVTEAEESHIYDELRTPDDSDRAPYSTPVFKVKQDKGINSHTYQNSALHSSDTGKDY